MNSKAVYCAKCNLHFPDVDARSAHVDSSSTHPICGTCCRRFLNDNTLSVHLKCAQLHLASSQDSDEGEILDGDEVLTSLTSELVPYFGIPEDDEDYWSSESDAGSCSSNSDSGTELESDYEMEQNHDCAISLAASETGPEYHGLSAENFVDSSEIRVACYCPIIDKSEEIATSPEERDSGTSRGLGGLLREDELKEGYCQDHGAW
ncbi:hypothetical protein B0H16DRAFT_1690726 [Mycena metata]|uniref:Uncharacterized protein n=1 Tax=Mycena metata TaxID=1033252 RepID=A0AAD7IZZ0_9AGAR|nr:hypothetical protein B0H16DRAFT_1690726 [Mycena metata]